tara:strand:- start:632 stop:1234 length:603 start_codon:yes stop_codon:yes gene_type:complete
MNEHVQNILCDTIKGTGDSDKHLMSLFSFIISLNAKNIIELGVRNGKTTLPLLLGAHYTNGKVTSVDIEDTSFNCPELLKDRWIFKKENALDFLKNYDKNNIIDFIFIDDWHSYKHVEKELAYLDMCVSPKSIIVLHDLMYGNYQPHYHTDLTLKEGQWADGGPYRAVAELNSQFWEFATIPSNNGLTILRKKYSNKYHN